MASHLIPGFTGGTFDRADRIRGDKDALAAAMADPRARLLRMNALDPELDADGHLVWDSLAFAPDDADLVFLGFEGDRPHFAAASRSEAPVKGRSMAIMRMLDAFAPGDAANYAAARSVVDWHMRHRFCAVCGTATEVFRAGWGRKCPNCGAEHFPRTDPVVIMIAEYQGKALLGRGNGWPPGRYSALAGFLEPGESIEEAVARETLEEAGVTVRDVRYVASQPWPFPSSLMIACTSIADSDTLTVDHGELEDAIWVTRDEARAALARQPAPFVAPPPYAIAHTLLTAWVGD